MLNAYISRMVNVYPNLKFSLLEVFFQDETVF